MTIPIPPVKPLTEADLDTINKALGDAQAAEALIDQAIQAGIDVEVERTRAREARSRLLRIKQTFFPGQ